MYILNIFRFLVCRSLLKLIICTLAMYFVTMYVIKINSVTFNSSFSADGVPDVFHYVIFTNASLEFIPFLSMVSVIKIHKPIAIHIHTNATKRLETGRYWSLLNILLLRNGVKLKVDHYDVPTHVFGQPLSSVYHASDIARLMILYGQGGVYLDTDCLVLKPLRKFMDAEMTLAWPSNDYIGNQVMIAKKEAKFLHLWINSYRKYSSSLWYLNAGQNPSEILAKHADLAERLHHEFGVQNLLSELYTSSDWDGWKELYALHLLSRHPPAPKNIDEYTQSDKTYSKIFRWILYEVEPKLLPGHPTWIFSNPKH